MTSKLSLALVPLLALGAFALPGCGGKTVARTESGASKDLSGNWNDVDAKTVSTDMISKALSAGWIDRFTQKNSRPPPRIAASQTATTPSTAVAASFARRVRSAAPSSIIAAKRAASFIVSFPR